MRKCYNSKKKMCSGRIGKGMPPPNLTKSDKAPRGGSTPADSIRMWVGVRDCQESQEEGPAQLRSASEITRRISGSYKQFTVIFKHSVYTYTKIHLFSPLKIVFIPWTSHPSWIWNQKKRRTVSVTLSAASAFLFCPLSLLVWFLSLVNHCL